MNTSGRDGLSTTGRCLSVLHISTMFKPVGSGIGYGGVERIVGWLLDTLDTQTQAGHYSRALALAASDHKHALPLFYPEFGNRAPGNEYYREHVRQAVQEAFNAAPDGGWDIVHDHSGIFCQYVSMEHIRPKTAVVLSCYAQRRHSAYASFYENASNLKQAIPWLVVTAASQANRLDLMPVLSPDFVVTSGHPNHQMLPDADVFYSLLMAIVKPAKCQLEAARAARSSGQRVLFAGPLAGDGELHASYARQFLDQMDTIVELERVCQGDPAEYWRELFVRSLNVYVGEIKSESVKEILFRHARKVVLLSGAEEAYSQVIQEAMHRGISVVAGPYASAIESTGGFGHLIDIVDDVSICNALATPPFSREAVQSFARAHHSLNRHAQTLEAVYLEALTRFSHHSSCKSAERRAPKARS
jgi:hypothetical protein